MAMEWRFKDDALMINYNVLMINDGVLIIHYYKQPANAYNNM